MSRDSGVLRLVGTVLAVAVLGAVLFTTGVVTAVPGRESADPSIRIDPDPVLSVGGFTEDTLYMLSEVAGGLRLDDGTVVVADRFIQGVRAYAPDGSYVGRAGGQGEGPGEYEYIRGLGRCSEHPITAFDLHWDLKLYEADLTLVEERDASLPGIARTPYDFSCAPSGHWLATGWGDFRAQFREGFYVATAPVVFGQGDELLVDFGERLSSERIGSLRPDGTPGGSGPHPFGRQTSVAIGPDRLYLGDAGGYRVEVYDYEGNRLPPLEWEGPDRRILPEHRRAFEAERLEGADPERAPALRRWVRELPEVTEFPAYDELRTDTEGNLWVRYFPRPGRDTTEWVAFAPDGTRLGELSLPTSLSPLDIGPDYLLAVEKGELDVETVHLYTLRRAGS